MKKEMYYKENRTGIIYRFDREPAKKESWTRVTYNDYAEQLSAAYNHYTA